MEAGLDKKLKIYNMFLPFSKQVHQKVPIGCMHMVLKDRYWHAECRIEALELSKMYNNLTSLVEK